MITTSGMSVSYLGHMGSDLTVANAARVSFGKHKDVLDDVDIKLIGYLARNGHWTPFAHCMLSVHVAVPIFVARQLVRHTIGVVINEESRRYVDEQPVFYMPNVWRGRPDKSIKQGSGRDLDPATHNSGAHLSHVVTTCLEAYDRLLAMGVAPEMARMVLPLNTITQFWWTGSIAAWARICKLRLDGHAQSETREVAEKISAIAAEHFHHSWAALVGGSS